MKKLSWTQRIALAEGIKAGKSNTQIAREIGVHRSTIGREIARNSDSRESYAPQDADLKSWERQKEAMPKRFVVTFCGVEFLSSLKKRNRIYTYISRTHPNALDRTQEALPNAWDFSYAQKPKARYMPDDAFARFQMEQLNGFFISFTGLQTADSFPEFSSQLKANEYTSVCTEQLFQYSFFEKHPFDCQEENFKTIYPIPLKSFSATDVSFLSEMKKLIRKTPFYFLKKNPTAVKI